MCTTRVIPELPRPLIWSRKSTLDGVKVSEAVAVGSGDGLGPPVVVVSLHAPNGAHAAKTSSVTMPQAAWIGLVAPGRIRTESDNATASFTQARSCRRS